MNHLRETFKDDFSSTAFRVVDGETRIIGKYAQISLSGEKYDVWFVGEDLAPLSTVRINSICKKLPTEADIHKLTGEAWFTTADIELVRKTIPLLGIKKRRKYSEKTREKMIERLRK